MEDNGIECRDCINFKKFSDNDDYGPLFICSKNHKISYVGYSWQKNHFPIKGDCEDFEEEKE